jgi:hypothetical protein
MPHDEAGLSWYPWGEIFHVSVITGKMLRAVVEVGDDSTTNLEAPGAGKYNGLGEFRIIAISEYTAGRHGEEECSQSIFDNDRRLNYF